MPQATKSETTLHLLNQLEHISDMISQNTDAASEALKAFKTDHQPLTQKAVAAKVDLLTLTIAAVRNNFNEAGIDDKKLFKHFKNQKKYDEAAQVILAKARHFFQNGNVAAGEEILAEVREHLLDKISPRVKVVYLTRMAFVHARKGQYNEKIKVSLEGLDILNALQPDAWHHNISTVFYTNIAGCYIMNSDLNNALPYLEQSLAITQMPDVSTYSKYNVYSSFAIFHEEQNNYAESVAWREKIVVLLTGDATHQYYLLQTYLVAAMQYHFLHRISKHNRKLLAEIVIKQDRYLHEASRIIKPDITNGLYLQFLYTSATLNYQKKNYKQAIEQLNTCMPQYIKMKHEIFMRNCYRLAHEIYYAWGKETCDVNKMLKAYELKQTEGELLEAQSMQTHLQKMEAAQAKHDLQQAELNSKLLKQQVEAMNKEVQLTALNLQEKIVLLDELKAFVSSLKRKDYEGRQFARAVEQKIGAVKITEQDKAVLQQKIDDGNTGLFRAVAEMYPALTPHEVRTCGLLKTGMTNKELSRLYGIGERGYEQLRHRIKKKMKLKRNDNLVKHLIQLSAKVQ